MRLFRSASVLTALLSCTPVLLSAAGQAQLDTNPALFSVMAALAAASPAQPGAAGSPLRQAARAHVEAKQPPVLSRIRNFIESHRKADPGADLAQYISFALTSEAPPTFTARFYGSEIPPDVEKLEGFHALMVRFHEEAAIDELWRKLQPEYEREMARYQAAVSQALVEADGYLRNAGTGYMGRRFFVLVELLAPPNQVHTRSYKDDYYIVVTPSAEPRIRDVRHAYLHYLVDPLAAKYSEAIDKAKPLVDFALGAPALEESYKSDFLLLAAESMIRTVESRMDRSPAAATEATAEGFILVPFFAEQLPLYEKQPAAMRLYLPDMLAALDVKKESKRLDAVKFAPAKTVRSAAVLPSSAAAEPDTSPALRAVEAADTLYGARQLEPARAKYLAILQMTDDKPTHARVYYGLARIAVLERNPELAEQLFRKTLDLTPDPHTRSWTEVYLGRLYENSGTPEKAPEHYRAALAVEEAPPGARQAAQDGLRKSATNEKH